MKKTYLQVFAVVTGALLISASAYAQYVWINERGTKTYSDAPPPASVPKDKIIKSPGNRTMPAAPAASATPATASGPQKNEIEKLEKPATLASKNEDFNKRKLAKEEADKKAEAERQAAMEKTKNCDRARSYKQSLEGGIVITSNDKNGERNILSESQRAKELADANKIISECK
jgi:hypothetical protein